MNKNYECALRWRKKNKERWVEAREKAKEIYYAKTKNEDIRSRKRYSKLEEELILAKTMSDYEIAYCLRRSLHAIEKKRSRLKEMKDNENKI